MSGSLVKFLVNDRILSTRIVDDYVDTFELVFSLWVHAPVVVVPLLLRARLAEATAIATAPVTSALARRGRGGGGGGGRGRPVGGLRARDDCGRKRRKGLESL